MSERLQGWRDGFRTGIQVMFPKLYTKMWKPFPEGDMYDEVYQEGYRAGVKDGQQFTGPVELDEESLKRLRIALREQGNEEEFTSRIQGILKGENND